MAYQGRSTGVGLSSIIRKIEQDLDEVPKVFLKKMAEHIVNASPVWSGEYVLNHTVENRSAGGQFTGNLQGWSVKERRPADPYKAQALANLTTAIDALSTGFTNVAFSNRSPHAMVVEYGNSKFNVNPARDGHFVYSSARAEASRFLAEAISEVKNR